MVLYCFCPLVCLCFNMIEFGQNSFEILQKFCCLHFEALRVVTEEVCWWCMCVCFIYLFREGGVLLLLFFCFFSAVFFFLFYFQYHTFM